MNGNKRSFLIFGLFLAFLFFSLIYVSPSRAQQEVKVEKPVETQAKGEPEKVVGAPRDIKEETGVLVFLAWIWLSIFVLVYFLRLKIKETDRLFFLRYFSSEKK
jgi:hypothetical protein